MKAFATAKLVTKYWKKIIFGVSLYIGYYYGRCCMYAEFSTCRRTNDFQFGSLKNTTGGS